MAALVAEALVGRVELATPPVTRPASGNEKNVAWVRLCCERPEPRYSAVPVVTSVTCVPGVPGRPAPGLSRNRARSESIPAVAQCHLAICARGDVARGAKCPVRCGLAGGWGLPVVS